MKLLTRFRIALLCLALPILAGAQTTDNINFNTTYQTIRGFGGSTAWMSALTTAQANVLFGTGNNQLGLTILRSRIDSSSTTGGSNWAAELASGVAAQKANSEVIVFATPWSPPAAWKSNSSIIGGTLNASNYDNFAAYLNAFIAYEKAGGVNLYAISVQNEPDYIPSYESCGYSAAQMDAFIAQEGGKINTKLMMPESDTFNTNMSETTLNDSNAVGHVSIVAGHLYGVSPYYYTNAKNKGKDVWETEHYLTPSGSAPTISDAISAAEEFHNSMAVAQYNAYVWWWIWNYQSGMTYGLMDSSNNPNYYGYALAQYSKFVRPGYVMNGANNNPATGVYVTAYSGSGKYVIVAINSNSSSASLSFPISGATLTSVTPYETSSVGGLIQQSAVSVSSSKFSYTLPAQSIITFVGTGSSSTSSFTLSRSASTLAVTQGSSATDTISVTDVGGFTGSVAFTASGLPSGVTASFSPASSTSSSVLTLTASSAATTGSSTVTITGTSGNTTATTTITLTVNAVTTAGFALTPSASSLAVTQGSNATDTISVTDVGGFTGSVAFAASGLPSGVTASFSPASSTSSSVLTLTAGSTAATGSSTVTITGTSGSMTETNTIALTVNAATSGIPTSYSWTSTGPLISAQSDSTHSMIAVKDPSAVYYNGQWNVYATDVSSAGNYNMEYLHFTDWSQASAATPYFMDNTSGFSGYHTAPQVFYFTPQSKWYLIFQSPQPQYSTNSDLTKPGNWTTPTNFFASQPSSVSNWIDFWVICDSTNCYLFFTGDNGNFYRSSTPIGNFPNGFNTPEIIAQDTSNIYNLFEADNVYSVKGTGQYLANIEAIGSNGDRYFRAFTASSLGGAWTALGNTDTYATPFLGMDNVTFASGASTWTNDFSSGGLLTSYDQTDTVDPNNLQFLYQGVNPASKSVSYALIPWQLGLATSNANTSGFTLAPSASTLSVTQGSSATDTISVTDVGAFTGSVTLAASGLPSGVTASFATNPTTGSSVLTLTASSTATAGSSTVTITGTSGSTTASTTIALTVNAKTTAGFTLAPSASSLSVTQGSSATDTITVTDTGGFTGSVAFTASGLPSGVTASFSPTSSTSSSVLTLTAGSSATTGAFTITVTGTSGSTTATTSFALSVSATSGSGISTSTYYTITNQASGLCVDDPSGATANGTKLQQFTCLGGNNSQSWLFTATTGGYYEVTSRNSTTAAWDVTGKKSAAGTGMELYAYGGGTNQQFLPVLLSTGYYEFKDRNSGLCLNVPSGTTTLNQQLQINTCNGATSESFKLSAIVPAVSTTHYYQVVNEASGLCIDDPAGVLTNGTKLQQYTCVSGDVSQEWLFTAIGNGYYEVTNYDSSTAAWDVTGAGTTAGTGMQFYTYGGGLNQQFEPVQFPSGYVEFIDHNSGLCLNVPSGTTTLNQQLQINTCNGATSEMFKLNQL
jgi:O-glycosyl hydrolase